MHFQKNSLILYFLTLTLYISTMAPTIYWGDSAEFSGTTFLLDIPHQPGYPLYNLIGKLFSFLPVGNIATRCNFSSTFFASLTSVLIYLILLEIFKNLKFRNNLVAIFGTLLFSFSYTFWNQSTFAEVYTLFVFLTSTLIFLLLILRENKDIRLFYLFVFVCGISLTNHLLILPLGSAFLFFIIVEGKLRTQLFKKFLLLTFLFLIPLTLYLYLPFRSADNPFLDWGNPENFPQFKWTITLKAPDTQESTYHPFLKSIWQKIKNVHILSLNLSRAIFILPLLTGFLLTAGFIRNNIKRYLLYVLYIFLTFSFIFSYFFLVRYVPFYQRVQGLNDFTFLEILLREYPIYVIFFVIFGIFYFQKKNRELFLFLIFLFFLSTSFIIFRIFPAYRPYDHYRFFIIGNLLLAIFITAGVAGIKNTMERFRIKYLSFLPLIFFVISLFFIFLMNYKTVNKTDYYYAEDFTRNILSSVSSPSLILIDGVDIYFLLYYWGQVKKITDKKIVFLDALKTRWYFEKLKREKLISENLFFSEKLESEDILDNLINLNYKRYKIYYTATASFSREAISKYCLKPRGIADLVLIKKNKCRYTEKDLQENKKLIYKIYKYRGINKKIKDRKATGVTNIYGSLHQKLAGIYLSLKYTDEAISELEKSIDLFPQNSSSYEILSSIYLQKNDIFTSIRYLEEAIKYDRGNIFLMNRLGLLYIDTGQFLKAEKVYKNILKIHPQFFEGHYNLGITYQFLGRLKEAINHLEIAKSISPSHYQPYLALGEIYYKNGEFELAKKYFEETLKINPANEIAKNYLKEILRR